MVSYFVQDNKDIINNVEEEILRRTGYDKTKSLMRSKFVYILYFSDSESFLSSMKPDSEKIVNGIEGADILASKFSLWTIMVNTYNRRIARLCLPMTYITEEFRRKKRGCADQRLYLLKKDVQRQTGLKFVTCEQFFKMSKKELQSYVVVQEFLRDPLIINGRKANLRVYLLIILSKGKTPAVYMYRDGFMYYTPAKYRPGSTDHQETITTGYIDRRVYRVNPLTHGDLRKYLGPEKSRILFNNIAGVLTVVTQAFIPEFKNRFEKSFHIFGADLQPDARMNVKLLEVNKSPDLSAKDERDSRLKRQMIQDAYDLLGFQGNCHRRRNGFKRLI